MFPELPATLTELLNPVPAGPHVRPIVEIHRGPDGYVTFHRKRADRLENLGSVRADELATMFPEFAAELERDSYFSVNSFYRPERFGNCLRGLKPAYRKAEGARHLNACFVDIDFHDQPGPFDFGYHFGQIITLQDRRMIPPSKSSDAQRARALAVLAVGRSAESDDSASGIRRAIAGLRCRATGTDSADKC
jgi:hypothetical protein